MQAEVIPAADLTGELVASWAHLQRAHESFDSAYFRPEFTQAVARLRPNVFVSVLRDGNSTIGFFPFERRGQVALPVGGRLSDYQAVIKDPGYKIDPRLLLRSCSLSALCFDHWLAEQTEFQAYFHLMDGSPTLDLSRGFDAYWAARSALGDSELKLAQRKARKMAREVGPLRVVADSVDRELLRLAVRWKSEQYRRTRITDVFSFPWTVELLEQLLEQRTEAFSGMLSALYAGDRPVALHMGMRSYGVLHYWFPTYDVQFARYSPGCILLLELARFCGPLGLQKIDMGRGVSQFKAGMMTGITHVGVGTVDLRPVRRTLNEGWRRTQDWIRSSPLRPAARVPGRVLYRCREWLAFR